MMTREYENLLPTLERVEEITKEIISKGVA
jgi:hypothetical protein